MKSYFRDGNGQGPFQLKWSGSRGRLGPGGVQGQGPGGGLKGGNAPFPKTNFAHFEEKIGPSWKEKC